MEMAFHMFNNRPRAKEERKKDREQRQNQRKAQFLAALKGTLKPPGHQDSPTQKTPDKGTCYNFQKPGNWN
jgi:hypothetical protein